MNAVLAGVLGVASILKAIESEMAPMGIATVEEILSRVQSELSETSAEIWEQNNKVFIRPPANWASGHTFADSFYDYDEYLLAGWILDANEDETLFWMMRTE